MRKNDSGNEYSFQKSDTVPALDKEVGKLRRELSRISKRKSDLYEDYSERLITEEEYIQFLESIPMKLRISRAVWTQYWRHRFGIPRITTLKKAGEM